MFNNCSNVTTANSTACGTFRTDESVYFGLIMLAALSIAGFSTICLIFFCRSREARLRREDAIADQKLKDLADSGADLAYGYTSIDYPASSVFSIQTIGR